MSETFHFNRKSPTRRMGVKCFHFKILMICQSICFSRRDSFGSFFRCWSHKLTLYSVVFKINIFFSKTQLAMQLPAEKKAGCHRVECDISQWLTQRGGRTYGRSDGDVITKTKRIHRFTKILYQWGSARSRAEGARGAPLK